MKTSIAALCMAGLVLPLVLEATLGCTLLLDAGENVADLDGNSYSCRCACTLRGETATADLAICMTPELNPNVDPDMGMQPDPDELADDCDVRVQENVGAMLDVCNAGRPASCDCAVVATPQYVEACDDPCLERPLDRSECRDFTLETALSLATNAEGFEPVCLAGGSAVEPLGAALLSSRSSCEVNGDAVVGVDDDSKNVDVLGIVEFSGGPCPGQSCDIGMKYQLDMDSVEFSGLFGLGKVRVEDLLAAGGSAPGSATLDASGTGSFAMQSARSSGQGTRRNFFAGVQTSSATGTVALSNTEPIDVRVDWQGKTCSVEGSLIGATVEGESDLGVEIDLFGSLVNQPPDADAGPDHTVECTSPAGGIVDLDGTSSDDPDDNIVVATWIRGGRLGDEVGDDFEAEVEQGLNIAETYYLKVIDAYLQASEDSAVVLVVDTTAPEITAPADVVVECDAPETVVDIGVPIFSDRCDDEVDVISDAPAAFPVGETIVIWSATDNSGNESTSVQRVTVLDTTPPALSLALDPTKLWPPNHKLVSVNATPEATDACDSDPAVRLASITSSEPDNAKGDGNTHGDIQAADFGADDRAFELRAERRGKGTGRVYSVRYEAIDASGNATPAVEVVSVPGNGKKK